MKLGQVSDGDSLFRHSIHPLSFDKKSARFVYQKVWHLQFQSDGAFHGSVAWERYVPTAEYVHGYGCRLASGINEKKRALGKYKEKDRHYYCGAYRLSGRSVRALAITPGLTEIVFADIVHQIESNEEIAHADLRIFLKPGTDLDGIEGTKTAIIDRLWNSCSGPLRHACDCDKDIPEHYSLKLETAPLGEYRAQTWLIGLWRIVMFLIFKWLWLNSSQIKITPSGTKSSFYQKWLKIKVRTCRRLWRTVSSQD